MAKRRKKFRKLTKKEAALVRAGKTRHYVACACGEEVYTDTSVCKVICGTCVQKLVAPPPAPKQPLTAEEKMLRAQRKAERKALKEAKAAGKPLPKRKDLGFTQGWHRRTLFKTEVDGKAQYFVRGQSVSKKEYDKVAKEQKAKKATAAAKPKFGRGWHFKKRFVSPDGTVYSYGKKVGTRRPVKKRATKRVK